MEITINLLETLRFLQSKYMEIIIKILQNLLFFKLCSMKIIILLILLKLEHFFYRHTFL